MNNFISEKFLEMLSFILHYFFVTVLSFYLQIPFLTILSFILPILFVTILSFILQLRFVNNIISHHAGTFSQQSCLADTFSKHSYFLSCKFFLPNLPSSEDKSVGGDVASPDHCRKVLASCFGSLTLLTQVILDNPTVALLNNSCTEPR